METREISQQFDQIFGQIIQFYTDGDQILKSRLGKIYRKNRQELILHAGELEWIKDSLEETHRKNLARVAEPYVNKIAALAEGLVGCRNEEGEEEIIGNISCVTELMVEEFIEEEALYFVKVRDAECTFSDRIEKLLKTFEPDVLGSFMLSLVPQFDSTIN